MNRETEEIFNLYCVKYLFLDEMRDSIRSVFDLIFNTFDNLGKILICGNGGSNADADHIVAELLKGFMKKRTLSKEDMEKFKSFGDEGVDLSQKLQYSLPAINLGAHTSLITAVMNDIGGDEIFAQQIMGYGNKNDLLVGISTSGNAKNVLKACITAKVKGMRTVGLTGANGGKMSEIFDVVIKAPSARTPEIQNMHRVIYHMLCEMTESEIWHI